MADARDAATNHRPEELRDDPRLADLSPTPGTGLTAAEAARRHAQGMGNDARVGSGRTYLEILRGNALNPVNLLLVGISIVLAALGLWGDAAVTIVLVLVNVVVAVYQEGRAKQTLDRLSVLTRPTATIMRDGIANVTDQHEVVLGDALVVMLGDQLMLDGRLIGGDMEVDESLLMGEPDRIPKKAGADVYSGSMCVSGTATYLVTRVGAESFANRLTAQARALGDERTPLQHDVGRVIRAMTILVGIAAIPVLIGIYLRTGAIEPIETTRAAAVLVALIPQGLIVMVTVTYALAIIRLAGGKALIQHSNAVESMSRVDILCLDKTGTLTTPLIEQADTHPFVDADELKVALGDFLASASLATRSADALRGCAARGVSGHQTRYGKRSDVLVRAALERAALCRRPICRHAVWHLIRARRAGGGRAARRRRPLHADRAADHEMGRRRVARHALCRSARHDQAAYERRPAGAARRAASARIVRAARAAPP